MEWKNYLHRLLSDSSFTIERKYEQEIADSPIMNVADLPIAAVRSPQIQSIMGEEISSSTDLSAFVGCFPSPALCVPFCVENDETSIAFRHTVYRVYPKDEDKRDPKKPDGPEVILMFVCGRPKYPVEKYIQGDPSIIPRCDDHWRRLCWRTRDRSLLGRGGQSEDQKDHKWNLWFGNARYTTEMCCLARSGKHHAISRFSRGEYVTLFIAHSEHFEHSHSKHS